MEKLNLTQEWDNIIYDKETRDTEIVRYEEDIDTYMAREVLPHVPDAKAFFEENLGAKNPVIKTGAEIIFTRQFYAPSFPESSDTLEDEFVEMSKETGRKIKELFS